VYKVDLLQLNTYRPRAPVLLPEQLTRVNTPLQWQEWNRLLAAHPDQRLRSYLVQGFTQAFRIGFARMTEV